MTAQQIWKLAEFIYSWDRDRNKVRDNKLALPTWKKTNKEIKNYHFDLAIQVTLHKVPDNLLTPEDYRLYTLIASLLI